MRTRSWSKSLPMPSIGLLIFATLLAGPASGEGAAWSHPVGQYKAVFTAPPRDLPADKMTDAPLLGNGDVAVALGGPPNDLQFFLGKSDFWGRVLTGETLSAEELADGATKYAHTKNGGRLSITIPGLTGASYRVEESLATALTQGVYSQGDLVLRTTSRVDANRNLLITTVTCDGGPVEMTLEQSTPDSGAIPSLQAAAGTAHAGHEQAGGGRWGFRGEIADLAVIDHALDPAEALRRASAPHGSGTKYDGKTWHPVETPKLTSGVTVSAWIKIDDQVTDQDVCYILSNGEWNQAYSLGLTTGKRLRFALAGRAFDTSPVPVGRWIHVAGVADSKGIFVYVDGKPVIQHPATCALDHGVLYGYRNGDPLPGCRRMAWATRVLGVPTEEVGTGLRVKLSPGETATLITALASDSEAADPVAEARRQAEALNESDLGRMEQRHVAWWTDFWNKSFIEIPDKVIEKHWYGALYALGSCSREGKLPPGLWGWATADSSAWCGSYTLNYNFEAPFFIAGPSNHPELLESYFRPIMEFVPKARELAKARGWKGIYLPTGIAPWGWHYAEKTHDDRYPAFADFAQRSNAAYAAVPFMSYWRLTHDERTLRQTVYPYLSGVAEFWEDYLKFENGRYVIYNDAIHEEGYNRLDHPVSQDMNSLVSLALVKQLFATVAPMSEVLGVDADKREKWREIAAHISAFPTQPMNGKTVFRYTEKGKPWHGDNTLGIQHIYPGNGIGFGSDPKLLEIARNTIEAMNRWSDANGTSTWYSACARAGYDPAVVLAKLRHECDTHGAPNLILRYGGGGMENAGTFACVTEMLLQSHEGVLRFFPCWPNDQDARFGTLRADGAFLVSAELKDGQIGGVKITSEKGRDCTVMNPWRGKPVAVSRGGKPAEMVSGDRFTLKTSPGESLSLSPQP